MGAVVGLACWCGAAAQGQRAVDRIVALVEGEPILLSEVQELGRFQRLVEGKSASEEQLLARLIEQWIVAREAEAARFAKPAAAEVEREFQRLAQQAGSPVTFPLRLRELGLAPEAVRRLLERQLYFARFLDYRFRPAALVEEAAVEKYYREELTAQLAARGERVPRLETVHEQIEELLIQREISARAGQWLDDAKSRLRIERRWASPQK
jgi:hypothetical protein